MGRGFDGGDVCDAVILARNSLQLPTGSSRIAVGIGLFLVSALLGMFALGIGAADDREGVESPVLRQQVVLAAVGSAITAVAGLYCVVSGALQ